MINKKFEVYKVQREIRRSGTKVKLLRPSENDYKEKDYGALSQIAEIDCLYHEVNSRISLQTGEITQYRTKKEPAFLALWQDIGPLNLRTGDIAEINGNSYLVIKVANIQEWNLIADVYLEVQDIGL